MMSTLLSLFSHSQRQAGRLSRKQRVMSAVKRKGATLLETTFVMIIIITIIGGALTLASNAMDQSTTVQETQTVNNLAGAVRKIKMANGYPADAEIGLAMHRLGFIPANVIHTDGTDFVNSWGGSITFQRQSGGGNFSITYTNIPEKECRQLVLGVKSGLLQSVGNTTTSSGAATYNIRSLTAEQVEAICTDNSGAATVVWSSAMMASS